MKLLFGMIVLAFIVLIFIAAVGKAKKTQPGEDVYKKEKLLSENEKQWYRAIKEAAPNTHIFGQVAMNRLLTGTELAARNKIAPRSIDFVLLKENLDVLMAIEIDDRSHNAPKRKNGDATKTHALKSAGIPLLRIPATPLLTSTEIKKRMADMLIAHTKIVADSV